jgi:ABC-2 type transport system permease protein
MSCDAPKNAAMDELSVAESRVEEKPCRLEQQVLTDSNPAPRLSATEFEVPRIPTPRVLELRIHKIRMQANRNQTHRNQSDRKPGGRQPALTAASLAARRVLNARSALVLNAAFYVLVVGVLSMVWRAATKANDGMLMGYSTAALTWYVCTSEAVTISMNARLMAEVGADIISGSVAVELLRPVSVLRQRIATELGSVLPRLAICALTGFVVASILDGGPPSFVALVLTVPSMILAVMLNIAAQHAFASASFWIRETGAAWFLYQKLVFMLGGMLIPLQLLPRWMHSIALATPFPSMAYIPARLASGHVEPQLLLVQLAWLAVVLAFAAFVFGRGERHLNVVGG